MGKGTSPNVTMQHENHANDVENIAYYESFAPSPQTDQCQFIIMLIVIVRSIDRDESDASFS